MHNRIEQKIMQNWKDDIEKPVVSICCTTYNHENYIAEAIDGFLMQETVFPFEILIRDDCSTDKTASIVKEYADKYPSLIKPVFEKKNTRSKGIKPLPQLYKIAKGSFIVLCDGDDYWTDPLKLQKQVDFLEKNPEYVITYHDMVPFNEAGEFAADLGGATRDLEAIELQTCTSIYTLTACFRNVVKDYPIEHNSSRLGDLFLWSFLGNHGKGKFLGSIKPAKYRVHEGGIFSTKSKQDRFEMALLTDISLFAFYNRIGDKKLATYFKYKMIENWVTSESASKLLYILFQFKKNKLKQRLLSKLKKYHLLKK